MLKITPGIADAIASGKRGTEIVQPIKEAEFVDMRHQGRMLVKAGIISVEELQRAVGVDDSISIRA